MPKNQELTDAEKQKIYYYREHEFKGRTLKPSKGRIDFAFAAGMRIEKATHVDILILIFACLCEEGLLMYAQRDPEKFLSLVMEWREKEVMDEDLIVLTEIAKEIIQGATETKAEPMQDISDLSQLPDPSPNG